MSPINPKKNKLSLSFYILILLLVLFFLIFSFSINSSKSLLIHSYQLETSKSGVRRVMNISYHDNQFFVFSDEPSHVRLYLDIVRDTICGLTLRTLEDLFISVVHVNQTLFNLEKRVKGADWPYIGISMIGQKRLINIEWALRLVIMKNVPGDFIECGVWRGGGSVFARAVLKALDIKDRHVWVADSFQGLPKARTTNDDDSWSKFEYLRVSLEEVQTNFRSFYLLDDQVHFCKGYFVDSLPRCNVSQIAVLRMDGDMYESTMDQFFNLYAKIQVGGVIIVDDYSIEVCFRAVHDFRNWHNVTDEIREIPGDQIGRYWIKTKMVEVQMHRYEPLLITKTNNTQS